MKTLSGNTYNIIETRTPTQTIWSMADKKPYQARQAKTGNKSNREELKALEKQLAELQKLAQDLMDKGIPINLDDEDEELLEDEQAVLSASKQPLDFDKYRDTQTESDTHADRDTHIQEDKHTPESETHTHIEGEKHTHRQQDTNSHTKRGTKTLRERPTYTPGRERHT